jgi:hypothetical protein
MTNKFHDDVDVVMENTEELATNVEILSQEYMAQLKDEINLSVFIHLQNVEKLLRQLKCEVKVLHQEEQKRVFGPLNKL